MSSTRLKPVRYGISRRNVVISAIVIVAAIAVALTITSIQPAPVSGSHGLALDPNFGIPPPPRDTPFSAGGHLIATVVMTLFGLPGVVLGVREYFRRQTLLPLMLALSGVMIAIPEVFVDVMGAVYYPWSEETLAYKILGREMPWWVVAGWFGFGAFNVLLFKALEANPPTKAIWQILAVTVLADILFEEFLLSLGVYHYYGNQPLVVLNRLPWWWIPCNCVGVMLAAALAYRYRDHLQGWKSLAMFFVTPMATSAVYGFIAMPSWIVVNGAYPWLTTQLAGLLTIVLGLAAFCLVLDLVLDRRPFEFNATGPSQPGRR